MILLQSPREIERTRYFVLSSDAKLYVREYHQRHLKLRRAMEDHIKISAAASLIGYAKL